jgi:hypothetical protein
MTAAEHDLQLVAGDQQFKPDNASAAADQHIKPDRAPAEKCNIVAVEQEVQPVAVEQQTETMAR